MSELEKLEQQLADADYLIHRYVVVPRKRINDWKIWMAALDRDNERNSKRYAPDA